jgi:hypothetical protein
MLHSHVNLTSNLITGIIDSQQVALARYRGLRYIGKVQIRIEPIKIGKKSIEDP